MPIIKRSLYPFIENKTRGFNGRISEDVSKVRMYVGPSIMYGFNLITVFALVIYYMAK
jgi:ATP-binding cassette, subfamily B, multidrug efflux pump